MKYFLLLVSIFIISCSSSSESSSDLCDPNPCKDSQIAHKTICEKLGNDDFKCVCEDGFNYDNGICKQEIIEDCNETETKCDGDNLLTCTNNLWESLDCTINSKTCELLDGTYKCACDTENGYFNDDNGECKNPCDLDGVCIDENKHQCTPSDAVNYTCSCDPGFGENNEGVCEAIAYCDSETYGSAFGLTGDALKAELNIIVNRTFRSYGYDDGRIAMFSYIDNDDGVIQCIYTGEYAYHPYVDDFSLLHKGCDGCADKPNNNDWNWEHTWPKSKGTGSLPAKADLHHLFPTRAYVNSARSSIPFGNVSGGDSYSCDDGNTVGFCESSFDYVSYKTSTAFEVANQHKGDTARAMFYIYVKYSLGGDNYLDSTEALALKEWHTLDPVDEKDRDRNNKVEMFQHNRNPFVDCPQFVDALYQ